MDINDYAKLHPHFYYITIPEILFSALKNLGPNKTIVDVGCGDGSLLHAILKKNLIGNNTFIGTDLSTVRIEKCKLYLKDFQFHVSTAEKLSFLINSMSIYDLIL